MLTTATYLTSTLEPPHHPGMNRRRFLLISLAGALVAPLAAGAQAGKVYRIGVLLPLGETPPILARFLGGMRDLGWVENQGFVAEPRYAEGRLERLPELAAELVRLKVDVLVTMGRYSVDNTHTRPLWPPASCRGLCGLWSSWPDRTRPGGPGYGEPMAGRAFVDDVVPEVWPEVRPVPGRLLEMRRQDRAGRLAELMPSTAVPA